MSSYKTTVPSFQLSGVSDANLKVLCRARGISVNRLSRSWSLRMRLAKDTEQAIVYDGLTNYSSAKEGGREEAGLVRRPAVKKGQAATKLTISLFCSTNAISNAHLINVLEDADRARTFHRFQELPAELRNMVYGYAINDFVSAVELRHPARMPAVCQTSRTVRREAVWVLRHAGYKANFTGLSLGVVIVAETQEGPKMVRDRKKATCRKSGGVGWESLMW
ncbi:hypothetical protein LTR10_012494 [Elasticomyces elasticus]|nr:hypothetical protein LTR10_012494 [Elasticomyces elasticus]KAK4965968.1 hypothetical protein LTR42_011982 [Elasticomyces elasticus]